MTNSTERDQIAIVMQYNILFALFSINFLTGISLEFSGNTVNNHFCHVKFNLQIFRFSLQDPTTLITGFKLNKDIIGFRE